MHRLESITSWFPSLLGRDYSVLFASCSCSHFLLLAIMPIWNMDSRTTLVLRKGRRMLPPTTPTRKPLVSLGAQSSKMSENTLLFVTLTNIILSLVISSCCSSLEQENLLLTFSLSTLIL
ncbi:hypothetical protein AAHE18_16G033300 [Arachis hypogaea]|nr:uncharacterized protein DS421_16g528680 [Arachis hypogaea]